MFLDVLGRGTKKTYWREVEIRTLLKINHLHLV
jgi:hypothetical protein